MEVEEFYSQYLNITYPYKYQRKIWSEANDLKFPILLRAPAGTGKTESILAPFLHQFVSNDFNISPRLVYVLPMRVLVNNIHDRIKKYADRISQKISVEIQHYDVPNAPFFISDIVVTTLDQFVYAFARTSQQVGKHIDVPAGAIASSLVVFDEAHMYRDEFTFSVMRAIMEILYNCKIPFIVMTATMPTTLENGLFENIEKIKKITSEHIELNSKITLTTTDKCLYDNNGVNIDDKLLEKIKSKKTLIVLNQVKRAQKVYDEIKRRLNLDNDRIVLLHSRFTKEDREKHEQEALKLIPTKNNQEEISKKTGIVISTQVLEAGIDFSAELLITELAPADALVQRAGRCARYKDESAEMVIFYVDTNDQKNKYYLPYKKEYMKKTWQWLKENNNTFNIKNYSRIQEFIDDILDYNVSDYEASDTLTDLYECVLYADIEPKNIQVRESKPTTILVMDTTDNKRKIEKAIEEMKTFKDKVISIDTGIAWKLFKDKVIRWEVKWEYISEEKKHKLKVVDLLENNYTPDEKDEKIKPFGIYIIDKNNYDSEIGIKNDEYELI